MTFFGNKQSFDWNKG